ncbi:MAG: domain containing protein [Pedosphaera sp.]|nr:domain containing protein [Pedosphaera sp.]
MKKRAAIIFAGVLLAFGGGMAAWHFSTKIDEPSYQEKTLTEWLMAYAGQDPWFTPNQARIKDALRHMGTNAIPILIGYLKAEDGPWRRRMYELLVRVDPKLLWRMADYKREMSYALVDVEEKDFETVVAPQLALLTNSPNSEIASYATVILRDYWKDKANFLAHPPKLKSSQGIERVRGFGVTNGDYIYRVYQKP